MFEFHQLRHELLFYDNRNRTSIGHHDAVFRPEVASRFWAVSPLPPASKPVDALCRSALLGALPLYIRWLEPRGKIALRNLAGACLLVRS